MLPQWAITRMAHPELLDAGRELIPSNVSPVGALVTLAGTRLMSLGVQGMSVAVQLRGVF